MSELALFGGPKAIPQPLTPYRAIGPEEVDAARKVIESGVLSRYLGTWSADFYGGETVQEFEQAWARHFRVRHAVSVNSNTSGLVAAVGAIGVEPGDEVIVTPWTMSAPPPRSWSGTPSRSLPTSRTRRSTSIPSRSSGGSRR